MKITLTRVLETGKILATDVGQKIPDFFQYMGDFVEQVVRATRNGLNFRDNFDCVVKQVTLTHDTAQTIQVTKPVSEIIVSRVVSQTYILAAFGWYYDQQNNLTIRAKFDPVPNSSLDVRIVVLF